jgi:hypothetical protein
VACDRVSRNPEKPYRERDTSPLETIEPFERLAKYIRRQILHRGSILHPSPDERVHALEMQLVKVPKAATIHLRLFDEDPLVSFVADVFQRALRLNDRLLIT